MARFQTVVEGGVRKAGQVEIQALCGLVLCVQNQNTEAVAAVERALTVAEPEGFIRVFVDDGE